MRISICRGFIYIFIALVSQGCGDSKKRTDIQVINLTEADLQETEVWFGKNVCEVGIMGPGGAATHLYYESPITSKALVTWVDQRGAKQQREVDLEGVYDKSKPGRLFFDIRTNEIKARFEPFTSVRKDYEKTKKE